MLRLEGSVGEYQARLLLAYEMFEQQSKQLAAGCGQPGGCGEFGGASGEVYGGAGTQELAILAKDAMRQVLSSSSAPSEFI